jgi:hypothetical protein
MSDETFSRRWLLLSVIGMLTSFLLTIGVAAFGFRGVASADQRAAKPTVSTEARASNGTFLIREIGGNPARTATATVGTAPTIRQTDEPLRVAQRVVQDPGGSEPPVNEPTSSEPEPTLPQPPAAPPIAAPSRSMSQPEPPPARMTSPSNTGTSNTVANASPTRVPDPPANTISEPMLTSTPVPRLGGTVTTAAYAGSTPEPPKPTQTPQSTATVKATATAPSQPPTVTIQISDSRIESGDSVTVTVYASDDEGLDWIDWEGVDTGERALDRESRYDCDGRTTCVQSWTVTVSRTGTHTLQARARDSKGNKSGIATTELRVRTAPPPTPTRVPVITAIPTRR